MELLPVPLPLDVRTDMVLAAARAAVMAWMARVNEDGRMQTLAEQIELLDRDYPDMGT